MAKIMGIRFNLTVGGPGGFQHTEDSLAAWTAEGLRRSWEVLRSCVR